jgi:hypothetical protein
MRSEQRPDCCVVVNHVVLDLVEPLARTLGVDKLDRHRVGPPESLGGRGERGREGCVGAVLACCNERDLLTTSAQPIYEGGYHVFDPSVAFRGDLEPRWRDHGDAELVVVQH